MYPDRVFNIHAHLRHGQDLTQRTALWRKWNVHKVCCGCLHKRMRSVENGGYFTNDDFLAIHKQYGDVLIGLAYVNLFANELSDPDDIERYREQGFGGLKCLEASYPFSHEAYWPLYERAEQIDMPILFHTGCLAPAHDGSDGRYGVDAENLRPYHLDKVARTFRKLKIIGAHLGKPHGHEALALMEVHPNVFFDFCGGGGQNAHVNWVRRTLKPYAMEQLDDEQNNPALVWFRKKFMFGTDNPEPDTWIPQTKRIMDELQIPQAAQMNYYWNTAATVFGLEA